MQWVLAVGLTMHLDFVCLRLFLHLDAWFDQVALYRRLFGRYDCIPRSNQAPEGSYRASSSIKKLPCYDRVIKRYTAFWLENIFFREKKKNDWGFCQPKNRQNFFLFFCFATFLFIFFVSTRPLKVPVSFICSFALTVLSVLPKKKSFFCYG